jgi:Iron-containing redox enzyme
MFLNAQDRVEECVYFAPLSLAGDRIFIAEAEAVESAAKIGDHPFFKLAERNKEALMLWTAQEAAVTNPFSQILFATLSQIRNVHVRALLMPVVAGEHGRVIDNRASKSHPWLIWELCVSLGLDQHPIVPTPALLEFVSTLERTISNPMLALGALGIGNELMLLSEYSAIHRCFEALTPEAKFSKFLNGNIKEDECHTKLIEDAAVALRNSGFDSDDFLAGAALGVSARVKYYDAIFDIFRDG